MTEFFVHYTVKTSPTATQHCVAGPYNEDEVLAQRRDISTYANVSNVYVSESRERAP